MKELFTLSRVNPYSLYPLANEFHRGFLLDWVSKEHSFWDKRCPGCNFAQRYSIKIHYLIDYQGQKPSTLKMKIIVSYLAQQFKRGIVRVMTICPKFYSSSYLQASKQLFSSRGKHQIMVTSGLILSIMIWNISLNVYTNNIDV